MIYFIKFITNLILPPGCFIVILVISALIQYKSQKKIPKLTISIAFLIYIVSIPFTANWAIHSLEYTFIPPQKIDGDVIIMLGGGATLDSPDFSGTGGLSSSASSRLLTTLHIYNKTKLPIILSGGKVYETTGIESEIARRQLLDLNVSKNDIIIENNSQTTTENAEFVSKILNKYHFSKPIIVTSAFHMKRSIINFSNAGIKEIIPYPTDYFTNTHVIIDFKSFIPSYDSFSTIGIALHEYLGIFKLNYINLLLNLPFYK